MSLIVKIMSAEDTADHDTRKGFQIFSDVVSAVFERRGDGTCEAPRDHVQPWLTLRYRKQPGDEVENALSFEPRGNVYVMNDRGQTVASYGIAPIFYAEGGRDEHPGRPPAEAREEWTRDDTDRVLKELRGTITVYEDRSKPSGMRLEFSDKEAHAILSQVAADFDGDDAMIKAAVQRFLGWRLPEDFNPDNGISFKPTFNDHMPSGPMKCNPTGTNLFDARQAEAMLRHALGLTMVASQA